MPLGDTQVSNLKSASLFKQSDFLILAALLVAMGVLAAARSTHYLFFHTMAGAYPEFCVRGHNMHPEGASNDRFTQGCQGQAA